MSPSMTPLSTTSSGHHDAPWGFIVVTYTLSAGDVDGWLHMGRVRVSGNLWIFLLTVFLWTENSSREESLKRNSNKMIAPSNRETRHLQSLSETWHPTDTQILDQYIQVSPIGENLDIHQTATNENCVHTANGMGPIFRNDWHSKVHDVLNK